jgi:putative ABC transport system ATP-binding protein
MNRRILVKEAVVRFGPQTVLDISRLAIGQSVRLAVMGESGSGKTTLLNILSGLENVSSGEVWWGDMRLDSLNAFQRDRFRGRNAGLVLQDFYLYPGLCVLDNVLLPTRLGAAAEGENLEERARALLDQLGLQRPRQSVDSLSRGEKQRVAIARALLNSPGVLLADEPTASLDAQNGAEVAELLVALARERGSTLICVTHDKALAARMDFCLELSKGTPVEAVFETSAGTDAEC